MTDPKVARIERWLRGRRPTPARLRELVQAMKAQGLGPATCNRYLSALSAQLKEEGRTLNSIPWQREPRGRTRVLTADEVRLLRLACAIRCSRTANLVGFLSETGLRVGESLALRAEDVEQRPGPPEGVRTVGANPTPATTYWAVIRSSKNGDPRRVPLTPEAARCWAAGFTGLSQSSFNHTFRWARDQVESTRGDAEVVPHALRHGCATRLVEAGVSLPVVGAWLGHRSPSSTYRYCHPGRAGLEQALRLLSQGELGNG